MAVVENLPDYEVFAIRYATRPARRADHFVGGDAHDGPMPMDYFVWVIKGPKSTFLVDTGFTAAMAEQRKRTYLRCPIESLALLGIRADAVNDVIITHLHYDHVGNFHKLPNARFFMQERELAYATGRYMKYPFFNHSFEVEEVVGMVRLNYKGRVELLQGEAELAPGVTVHPAPGHTAGLQIVRVHTRRGWVILASDSAHYYENLETNRPFSVGFHLGEMIDAFRLCERLASSPRHIVPGHDPRVMQIYPGLPSDTTMAVARLDAEPTA